MDFFFFVFTLGVIFVFNFQHVTGQTNLVTLVRFVLTVCLYFGDMDVPDVDVCSAVCAAGSLFVVLFSLTLKRCLS